MIDFTCCTDKTKPGLDVDLLNSVCSVLDGHNNPKILFAYGAEPCKNTIPTGFRKVQLVARSLNKPILYFEKKLPFGAGKVHVTLQGFEDDSFLDDMDTSKCFFYVKMN